MQVTAEHDRRVYVSVLALGLAPERARDITQQAWTRLLEQQASGALTEVELPGLAIRQARFLALNELKRGGVEKRVLAAVPDTPPGPGVAEVAASREEIAKVLDALRGCSVQAQKVFRGIYVQGKSASEVATEIGLSLQRVRQILCETRAALKEVLR